MVIALGDSSQRGADTRLPPGRHELDTKTGAPATFPPQQHVRTAVAYHGQHRGCRTARRGEPTGGPGGRFVMAAATSGILEVLTVAATPITATQQSDLRR